MVDDNKHTQPVQDEAEDATVVDTATDMSDTSAAVTAAAGGDVGRPLVSDRVRQAATYVAWAVGALIVLAMVLAFLGVDAGWPTEVGFSMLDAAVDPQTAAVAVAVIGLNIHFGYTGLLNFGQAGFMLLGAYGFAISISEGVPLVFAILIGFAASGLFAVVLGVPTLKLRGDYLAIVTISAAEIVRYVGRAGSPAVVSERTGGPQGIEGQEFRGPINDLSFLGTGDFSIGSLDYIQTGANSWWVRLVAWCIVLLCALVVFLLVRSPWGRLLRGVREDEDAIRSLGKNVFAIKMQALVLGGMFGALAGMLYILPASLVPDSMGRTLTFYIWTALLLGGAATVFGPVLGAILFFVVRILVTGIADNTVPDSVLNTQQAGQFGWIVIGVSLMLLVIFRPQGVLGDKRELRFNV
ncbi:branched-chain amino acid ABC transporter permease [Nocardioides sp. TF02-7]|uniref:branched-chain amino acid ABC transporter permease n=1 Tax=Nocardioides sp. TF02-7 TaxID=2917724 RepID=UPI001F05A101|nr:branched-chain amino acid ABC transporter permease [Nocardioides sp. TF02-7]UMG92138.1 branched-chain amino acid ABC transporter permease [Nocardioides sp. TF02-7]